VAERATWSSLIAEARGAGLDANEARWIGEEVSGAEGATWAAIGGDEAPDRHVDRFRDMVGRRAAGEPLQYVLGAWSFRGLDLLVDRRVLVPRPETEWVVEQAIGLLPAEREAVVVDLGTGSGAIALSIAAERWPRVRVVATDRSVEALAVARANLAGLGRRATRVELRQGSWWEALPVELRGTIDLVVSNPPYVAAHDGLPPEVAAWEPIEALVSGPTGLEAVEVVLAGAGAWLRPEGWVVCEIGDTQADAVRALATSAGLGPVEIRTDLTGRDRMVVARRPG